MAQSKAIRRGYTSLHLDPVTHDREDHAWMEDMSNILISFIQASDSNISTAARQVGNIARVKTQSYAGSPRPYHEFMWRFWEVIVD
jgi:hypothetical protein